MLVAFSFNFEAVQVICFARTAKFCAGVYSISIFTVILRKRHEKRCNCIFDPMKETPKSMVKFFYLTSRRNDVRTAFNKTICLILNGFQADGHRNAII